MGGIIKDYCGGTGDGNGECQQTKSYFGTLNDGSGYGSGDGEGETDFIRRRCVPDFNKNKYVSGFGKGCGTGEGSLENTGDGSGIEQGQGYYDGSGEGYTAEFKPMKYMRKHIEKIIECVYKYFATHRTGCTPTDIADMLPLSLDEIKTQLHLLARSGRIIAVADDPLSVRYQPVGS